MSRHIVLDSSPLGLLSNHSSNAEVLAIGQWSYACIAAGHTLYIPEVIDYELRRELLRAGKQLGLTKLNRLKASLVYLPITTTAMLRAANLWASSRQQGFASGDPKKLDIDVILAAQAPTLPVPPADILVATANVRHVTRYVAADVWTNIKP